MTFWSTVALTVQPLPSILPPSADLSSACGRYRNPAKAFPGKTALALPGGFPRGVHHEQLLDLQRFIAAGGTEDDCSVRRMHQAALSWMSYARSVDELEARERGGPAL